MEKGLCVYGNVRGHTAAINLTHSDSPIVVGEFEVRETWQKTKVCLSKWEQLITKREAGLRT